MASNPEIPFEYSYSAVFQRLKISADSSRREAEYWQGQAAILSTQREWYKSAYTMLRLQYGLVHQHSVELAQTVQRQQHEMKLLEQERARNSEANPAAAPYHDLAVLTQNQDPMMPYPPSRGVPPQTASGVLLGSASQGLQTHLQGDIQSGKRRAESSLESDRSPKRRNFPRGAEIGTYGLPPISTVQSARDGEGCVEWAAGESIGSGILSA